MDEKQLFKEYKELFQDLIQDEVKKILKEENFFRALTGTVVTGSTDGSSYGVDIINTTLNDVANKTGQKLSIGDTVTILERYGSNYSNCYISVVNGVSGNKIFKQENGDEADNG